MKSLAVIYRPQTFDDVVEQDSIKLILSEQLKTNTQKNSYLFTGGAGTGKTTCARIFAKMINNQQGEPIEIDAASNNGVENVRDIINDAKFKSLNSEFKVYIIDECHMLSNGAWNAMLKILEEPPAKTIFIFCTTDPQKIPNTIISRVQRYDFKRISYDGIRNRLIKIIDEENKTIIKYSGTTPEGDEERLPLFLYEKDAIDYIAKLADGGMRDAITMMDKCFSFNNNLTVENIVKALGTVNYEDMIKLTHYIYIQDSKGIIDSIEELYRSGADLKYFIKQYNNFILDLCKYSLFNSFEYIQIPKIYEKSLIVYNLGVYINNMAILDKVMKLSNDLRWETMPKVLIQSVLLTLRLGEE